ncbi:MAG: NAD(P)H-hydrate dehydratase [Lachnospiraceae bacterium]|nr:NAD(P)H-hydrate dehydratase [Lachnospiraceae bacterium]
MRNADKNTSEEFFLSSDVLMERAALAVCDELLKACPGIKNILIVSGPGNNGGDGIAAARILRERGYFADVCIVGDMSRLSELTDRQLKSIEQYDANGKLYEKAVPDKNYDAVIDALFGISLNRNIEGDFLKAVTAVNEMKKNGTFVLSIDIPSGINGLTGAVMGEAVNADLTLSCGFEKSGTVLFPGAAHAGVVKCADIGISEQALLLDNEGPFMCTLDPGEIKMPPRISDSNKGSYGKILIVAGSREISGAAVLSAKAAMKSGAGMVKVFTHETNRTIVGSVLPEALIRTYSDDDPSLLEKFMSDVKWSGALVIGPGLSTGTEGEKIVEYAVKNMHVMPYTTIYDADALNILSKRPDLMEILLSTEQAEREGKRIIFTPHIVEMSRLSGLSVSEIKADPINTALDFAYKYNVILVLKDARTVIATPSYLDNDVVYINTNGNNGMATAGSGDVLSGIIASFSIYDDFTELAVAIHGRAGDIARDKIGPHAMTAMDIIDCIGQS